jgi:hypothetical protein
MASVTALQTGHSHSHVLTHFRLIKDKSLRLHSPSKDLAEADKNLAAISQMIYAETFKTSTKIQVCLDVLEIRSYARKRYIDG